MATTDQTPSQRVLGYEVLHQQQRARKRALRDGDLDSPREVFLELHHAAAVSLGYVHEGWIGWLCSTPGWYDFVSFIGDPDVRATMLKSPPQDPAVRRQRHVEQMLTPGYQQAIGLISQQSSELDISGGQPGNQRHLAMRPHLQQMYDGQRKAHLQALGHEDASECLDSREDVNDWVELVVTYAPEQFPDDWPHRVQAEFGPWYRRLLDDHQHGRLYELLGREVIPRQLAALRQSAKRGEEIHDPDTEDVDPGPTEAY